MVDIGVEMENRPGSLAALGEALGNAGINIEGGGAFVVSGRGVAHFLVSDGPDACRALEAAGLKPLGFSEVVIHSFEKDEPGQLGRLLRRLAAAGVNIDVFYSDHGNRKILVVDDPEKARRAIGTEG